LSRRHFSISEGRKRGLQFSCIAKKWEGGRKTTGEVMEKEKKGTILEKNLFRLHTN